MDLPNSMVAWEPSPEFFNGERHDFCYVCGGSLELFGCKTCSTSYHASCMSPTLEPDEVPPFWYCPHCVDREMHMQQPVSPTAVDFSHPIEVGQLYPSPNSIETTRGQVSSVDTTSHDVSPAPQQQKHATHVFNSQAATQLSRKENLKTIDYYQATLAARSEATAKQPKRKHSPPRKRSKYSTLSSEVDKALIVIQKELEKVTKFGKSEDDLRARIQDLEQQIKLKDGQIMLARRELELARNNSSNNSSLVKAELADVKARNSVLMKEVEKKDAELRDWKEKLKGLLGAEMHLD